MSNRRTRIPSGFASIFVICFILINHGRVSAEAAKPIQNGEEVIPASSAPQESGYPGSPQPKIPVGSVAGSTGKPAGTDNNNDQFIRVNDQRKIDLALLAMGLAGIVTGFYGFRKLRLDYRTLQTRFEQDIKRANSNITLLSNLIGTINDEWPKNLGTRLKSTEKSIEQLCIDYETLNASLSHQVSSSFSLPSSGSGQVSLNQTAILRSSSDQTRTPSPSFNVLSQTQLPANSSQLGATPIKTAAQHQEELTAAVNRNDRLAIRNRTRTQLNITSDSESAYAIGKLVQTELEEVNGGGSYLLLELDSQLLLYPTDQTLRGFGQAQPTKGVFTYQKQPIATPQVLTPALVELVGSNWRVKQLGTIAVPG